MMKIKNLILFFFLQIIVFLPLNIFATINKTAQASNKTNQASRISLPDAFYQDLYKDSPLFSMVCEDINSFWILGQKFLWNYRLDRKDLTKFDLGLHKKDYKFYQTKLHFAQGFVLFSLENGLLQFATQENKSLHLYGNKTKAKDLKYSKVFFSSKQEVFWLLNQRLFQVILKNKEVKFLQKLSFPSEIDDILYVNENSSLWYIKENKLYKKTLSSISSEPIFIASLSPGRKSLSYYENNIIVESPHSLLIVDFTGRIEKTISVLGGKKLLSQNFNPSVHSFIFTDNVVELFHLKKAESYFFSLRGSSFTRVNSFFHKDNRLAFIGDGQIYFYETSL